MRHRQSEETKVKEESNSPVPLYRNEAKQKVQQGYQTKTEELKGAKKELKEIKKHVNRHTYEVVSYNELPEYLKDNHFIHTGHRADFSFWLCIKSLFQWHNDTLCIWTHLLATIGFGIMTPITLYVLLDEPTVLDQRIFMVFLLSAVLQMGFSAIFHTFGCSSPGHLTQLAKLDYIGITVMIVGSNFPPLYYGFYCHPNLQIFYLGTISIFGILGLFVSCIDVFSTPSYRLHRLGFFLVFGFCVLFSMPHFVHLNSWEFSLPILWREVCMGLLYSIGAFFYATRWPESKYPGRVDHGFSSHVIWHIFTILAAMMQSWSNIVAFNQRHSHPCPASS
eukprot:TRINITY_DN5132_c0_g1_i1.p2 TRINITY_DN5132_c0_g1~~TRINITY_DN5132_c0_g1_i1.p2  ORF type:complete len:335 (-),score=58.74 TRINITY_DN5132_c0_g1_i1:27-1031(-)